MFDKKVKVTFLGTGTSHGVPMIACACHVCKSQDPRDKRLRASIQVETAGQTFVIDTGPDFRQQMLRNDTQRLDAVLFTHQHKDHTGGLDDIRTFNFLQKKDMPVYATEAVLGQLRQEYAYIFSDKKYPGVPCVETIPITKKPFSIGETPIIPIEVLHHKLPVLGFRFHDFTYITDANYISEEEMEKIKGSKVLVINALQRQGHLSHFSLSEALEVIQKIAPEKTFLTHLSHKMGTHADTEKELPDNVRIAWDGMKIEV